MRKQWSTKEIELLREVAKTGGSYITLARELGRSPVSVRHKASKLGITFVRKPVGDLDGEVWKQSYIADLLVSNLGRFKRASTGSQISGTILTDGYVQVEVSCGSGSIKQYAHRLVAEAFIPNPQCKPEVNHKNRVKTDNSVSNLEWVTRAENMIHAHATGFRCS